VLVNTNNHNDARVYGLELAADWHPRADWRLQANYSWIRLLGSGDNTGTPPEQQFSLRSSWNVNPTWQWDVWLRAVSATEIPAIPAYATLDTRLSWKARPDLEISLVGQNLLDPAHPEHYSRFLQSLPSEVERGVYLKMDLKF
jgi:iron complex outermembrane receptor protein